MSKSRVMSMLIVFFDAKGIEDYEFVPPGIGVSTVPQSPYSPDVDLADFFLFPRVKYELKGKYLETLDNIPKTTTKCLYRIPRSEFQRTYNSWKTR
ncbi:hypothetical protein LAZ67_4002235 [Cordylochernes scorpioides]|uniref:Uncharacterized protein n=1 Tax=Cordylochernes scorpioides TaxID=51811 RepID=A0ABY6KG03_9ARAC|nr:hypothetical protein LAZ67_4002235 [Cordylochernes scorpioides]